LDLKLVKWEKTDEKTSESIPVAAEV
jgi:hypothetical protein